MRRKKVLLILCPPLWEKLPPAGLGYLCEYLSQNGHEVSLYDLNIMAFHRMPPNYRKDWTINSFYTTDSFFTWCFENHNDLFKHIITIITNEHPDFTGFSVFKSNRIFSLKTACFVRQYFPDLPIIFGGPEVFSLFIEGDTEHSFIDFFVIGEGEDALLDIVNGKREQQVILFRECDSLSFFPRYSHFTLPLYTRKNGLPIVMSRGCIHRCSFCSERLLFHSYRVREPEQVIEEMEYHIKEHGTTWFTFYDSLFNGNLMKLERLLDLILSHNLNIAWDAQIGVRTDMAHDLLTKMKQSGCINLFVGLESGSDRVLTLMNKPFSSNDAITFLNRLFTADLSYEISLIVNYPGETDADFSETLRFIVENRKIIKKIAQINPFIKYPGTKVPYPENYNPEEGEQKVQKLLTVIRNHHIPYTKSFINNLI